MKKTTALLLYFLITYDTVCLSQSYNTAKSYCPTSNSIARDKFEIGNNFLVMGNLDKAAEAFQAATIKDSLYCDAWDNLAVVMRRKGDYNKALTYYLKAFNINNKNDVACTNSAEILFLANKPELALKWFARAIEIDSTNPESYFGQSKCFLAIQDYDNALIKLNQSKALYIKKNGFINHDVYFIEGSIYYSKGDIPNAISLLEQEYNFFSENPTMNYYLGNCYLDPRFENKELAKKYLGKAEKGFAVENKSNINVVGKWKILKCQFKIPGWHTDSTGDLYQFKSDQNLTITPADSLSHISTHRYTINETTLTLITENDREVEYKFKFISEVLLELENDLVKLVLNHIKD